MITLQDIDGNLVDLFFCQGIQNFRESFSPDGAQVEVWYECDWDDRYKARNALLGQHRSAGFGNINRTAPHFLTLPGSSFRGYATVNMEQSAPVVSDDAPLNTPRGLACRFHCLYKPLPFKVTSGIADESTLDRWVKKDRVSSTRILTMRGAEWVWGDEANFALPEKGRRGPASGDVALHLPKVDITWTWFNVPDGYVPVNVYDNNCGKVNSETFIDGIDGMEYPPYTLLFLGARPTRHLFHDGTWVWDIAINAVFNRLTWFKVPDPLSSPLAFREIVRNAPTLPVAPAGRLYEAFDFADLFRLAV